MKHSKRDLGFAIAVAFVCVTAGTPAFPAEKPPESGAVNEFTNASEVVSIDLPAALRLAGAQNLDVQIARE
ncbi:MAG TPA: hypothetical protein VFF11_02895, partial [Candidatus Binatia bacterium]|nr:hypothetical protein [Candidatus Binatia bacterium]